MEDKEMKIMYLCNCLIPNVAKKLNVEAGVFGGWLSETINAFAKDNEVVFMCPYKEKVEVKIDDNFTFVGFTAKETESFFEKELNEYQPDIVHIWGSEFMHSYYMSEALKNTNKTANAVLSLQGIISEIAKVYDYGIPKRVVRAWTFGDIFRRTNIAKEKAEFLKRGEYEKKAIKNLKNVIGRTQWDKNAVKKINPAIIYYKCAESLRNTFYDDASWERAKCESGRIFICQISYPIKGFHLVLPVLAKLKKEYPFLKIVTTGKSFTPDSLIGKLKQSSYQKYIRKSIIKYKLRDNIEYLGTLDAEGIKRQLLKSNLLLSPSVIENSPNSIGEAMMLGVPVVSSNVGGVSSIISNREGYMYCLGDEDDIFEIVKGIILSEDKNKHNAAKHRATIQYNIEDIKQTLGEIYTDISEKQ